MTLLRKLALDLAKEVGANLPVATAAEAAFASARPELDDEDFSAVVRKVDPWFLNVLRVILRYAHSQKYSHVKIASYSTINFKHIDNFIVHP